MKRLITVTDDITGAADSGGYFVRRGKELIIYTGKSFPIEAGADKITSFNLSSRNAEPADAYKSHYEIGRQLKEVSNLLIMKKIGTGFRGNDPYELSGMLAAMPDSLCFVVDHAPDLGTFTLYGNQYCEGEILTKSLYASDPVMPPAKSYIPDILSERMCFPVGLVNIDAVKGGDLEVETAAQLKNGARVVVFDAITKEDSLKIVRCLEPIYPQALWTGSLGIAETLAQYLYGDEESKQKKRKDIRCICFTASAYGATKLQIAYSEARGLKVEEVDVDKVIDGNRDEIGRAVEACILQNKKGNVILRPKVLKYSYQPEAGSRILSIVTECARRIAEQAVYDRLVVIGGETAQGIFKALQIEQLILKELPEVGTAVGIIPDSEGRKREFALKGGSIGSEKALEWMLGKEGEENHEWEGTVSGS